MHFFHKWEVVKDSNGVIKRKNINRCVVVSLQECIKCKVKRGVVSFFASETWIIKPQFAELLLQNK